MNPTPWRCALAVCLLVMNPWTAPVRAQEPPPKVQIVVAEGEGVINNVNERLTHEPAVQVQDQNQKPIAGASVVFFLPTQGPSGAFSDGSKTLTLTTDAQGRAVARGIKLNGVAGQMQIRVTASSGGQTATAIITQTNIGGGGKGLSKTAKVIIIVALIAGGTAGAIAATRGGSSSTPAAAPPITITAGTPTVGAP